MDLQIFVFLSCLQAEGLPVSCSSQLRSAKDAVGILGQKNFPTHVPESCTSLK